MLSDIIQFICDWFFETLFIIVGLGTLVVFLRGMLLTYLAKDWSFVTGEIVESHVKKDPDDLLNYKYLKYIYRVNGIAYCSDRVYSWGNIKTSIILNNELIPIGKEILVYYNPHNPQKACLIVSGGYHLLMLFCVAGLAFLVFGISSLLGYPIISFKY